MRQLKVGDRVRILNPAHVELIYGIDYDPSYNLNMVEAAGAITTIAWASSSQQHFLLNDVLWDWTRKWLEYLPSHSNAQLNDGGNV